VGKTFKSLVTEPRVTGGGSGTEGEALELQEIIIRGVYRFALVRHTELTKSDTPLATRALGIG
jgi:hypothetical protein